MSSTRKAVLSRSVEKNKKAGTVSLLTRHPSSNEEKESDNMKILRKIYLIN